MEDPRPVSGRTDADSARLDRFVHRRLIACAEWVNFKPVSQIDPTEDPTRLLDAAAA
jgi:hypothetical protein